MSDIHSLVEVPLTVRGRSGDGVPTPTSPSTIKPFDEKTAVQYAKNAKFAFVLEEHSPVGGLGSAVAETLANYALGIPFQAFSVPEGSKQTGPYRELLAYYGLTGEQAAQKIAKTIGAL